MLTVFSQRVLAAIKKIPVGRVSTYREIARILGQPQAARAVGQALKRNPQLIKVPCHRVVSATGALGGYAKGISQKKQLLLKEGIKIKGNKIVNFNDYFWNFK